MTSLNTIVEALSFDKQKSFIIFLEKKNKRNDTKNVQLFKLLVQGELNTEQICQKLYPANKKDAFYALRKRLHQSIIDFTANNSLEDESSIDMQIIKYILAARNFLSKGHYKMAYKIVNKAEALANEHQLFALLNEIYHTKIQYAYKNAEVDLSILTQQFKRNQQLHKLDEELNIAYAKIRSAIKTVVHEGKIINFQELVEAIFEEHHIDMNKALSFKSLYQLVTIVSISAFVTKDYYKIEPFLLSTYETLKNHKSKDKQSFYHIHVLFAIANTLFRNKKFNDSLHYLDLMHEVMLSKRKKHYKSFQLKYNLLLGLNKNYLGEQNDAIEILEQFIQKSHPDLSGQLDLYLSLIMCYFQKGEFKKAMSIFSKFYHTDKWYIEKAGKEWILKKNLIEILLHLELGNIDLFESRLLSFKRSYYEYLRKIGQERAIQYLSLVEEYYKAPELVTSEAFKEKVENSFEWIAIDQEDIFVMSFYAWLKSKMTQESVYQTTLALLRA
ncbi:MAG: hypothetical protein JKY02_10210 [Flavobacteriaceae bacterium]|nr:hypothetical protein [Flavobacteriaceae bacterium]